MNTTHPRTLRSGLWRKRWAALAVWAALALALGACSTDATTPAGGTPLPADGETCGAGGACGGGLACLEDACVQASVALEAALTCASTADCPAGDLCEDGVCVSATGDDVLTCASNADCPDTALCLGGLCVLLADADGDGSRVGADCDDTDAEVHPGAGERCDNAIDDDCDGETDEDCGDACAPIQEANDCLPTCASNADCPPQYPVCAAAFDGCCSACVRPEAECGTDDECPAGEICVEMSCELPDEPSCEDVWEEQGCLPTCATDADCPPDARCVESFDGCCTACLRPELCTADDECPADHVCDSGSCVERPDVEPTPGLHVQLVWQTPADPDETDHNGTDLDLHLIHPNAPQDVTAADLDGDGEPDPYFDPLYDCYWSNRTPDWGVAGDPQDDPMHDIDDVDGGGPENINIYHPEAIAYRIAVTYFGDRERFGDVLPTVRVFLGGVLVAEVTGVRLDPGSLWCVGFVDVATGEFRDCLNDDGSRQITPYYPQSW